MVIEKMTVIMRKKLQKYRKISLQSKNNFETLQSMDVLDQDALNEYQENAMEGWFDIGDKVLSLLNENKRGKHKRSFWKNVPLLWIKP